VTETISPMPEQIDQQQLAQQLVQKARAEGVELVGPGGLLAGLTKTVLETALDAELSEHLGYDKHDPAGRNGGNSRNGTRSKTVLTEVGPVEIEVPRDRDGSFDPVIVRKRQRRLEGIARLVDLGPEQDLGAAGIEILLQPEAGRRAAAAGRPGRDRRQHPPHAPHAADARTARRPGAAPLRS
jgi:Transposase, Mutator family